MDLICNGLHFIIFGFLVKTTYGFFVKYLHLNALNCSKLYFVDTKIHKLYFLTFLARAALYTAIKLQLI